MRTFSVSEMYAKLSSLGVFDERHYLSNNPDVVAAGLDPLVHYLRFGSREGRSPTPYFDPKGYLELNPDVAYAGIEPFFHYAVQGVNETRRISSPTTKSKPIADDAPAAARFDAEFYLRSYKDVADAKLDPEYHYLTKGEKEGRRPNKLFDPKFYARVNPDVAAGAPNLFDHFRHNGWREGRLPSNPADALYNDKGAKNILFFGHDAIQAGAQKVLADIIRWFAFHTDYRVYLVLSDVGFMISEYARCAEVYVFHNYNIVIDDRVLGLLDVEFEFAYANTVRSAAAASVIVNKLRHKTKIITHLHELDNVLSEFDKELKLLIDISDMFIVVNPTIRDYLIRKYCVKDKSIIVESPFITAACAESDPIAPRRLEARERLHISPNAFVVAGCGTAYSRKGIDLFVEAAIYTLRKKSCGNAYFVWFGDGQDLSAAQATVLQAGLSTHFSFPGHRADAHRLLACADVFVLSSREDPFPLVCLEAAQVVLGHSHARVSEVYAERNMTLAAEVMRKIG